MIKDKINYIKRLVTIKKLVEKDPKPSLYNLDDKLSKYLNYENGFFIELGANNGYKQSNTFYLEYIKSWKGLLIEGIPELYTECKYLRINSFVENCACVSSNYNHDTVTMQYADLMSIVNGALKNEKKDIEHIEKGIQCQKLKSTYSINVPARTLTSVIEKYNPKKIDFLSLDVEGYEIEVLKGLDFSKYTPDYICVEARFEDEIINYLSKYYSLVERLTKHDLLFKFKKLI